ncbi:MAG: hypothetical protein OET44_14450 [Gammaproteobacteria bacterium]|nr:hypothetical protein [Gammaproteobacteria bacterium]
MTRSYRIAWLGGLIAAAATLVICAPATAGGPELSAQLPDAAVKIALPADKIDSGTNVPFKVSVSPASGKPAPLRIRARLGMPFMGHWVTGEEIQAFQPEVTFDFKNHLEMDSALPMNGWYRLRVWLDYADGHEAKTAVDFRVMTDEPLDAKVVE